MHTAIALISSLAFGTTLELAALVRWGPPAREFDGSELSSRGALPTLGLELGGRGVRAQGRFGVRPSFLLEAWGRRWDDAQGPWAHEFGVRMEPRLSGRWVFTPRALGTRAFSVATTLDVGVGAAVALFLDDVAGAWAFSPTLSARPTVHLGGFQPAFLALDLRVGVHRQFDACPARRTHCPGTELNAGGTSVGLVLGHAL